MATDLRRRTVRGAAITAAFVIGIDAIVAAQGLVVTRLLGPKAIGLYGLVDAGKSEWAQALFGLRRLARGRVEIDGYPYSFPTPGAAVADNTHPLGRSAQTAHAWLDTLHSRYQLSKRLARTRR